MSKKHVLLLFPKVGLQPKTPQVPLSLLTLCPGLEGKGYIPIIIDTRVEPDYRSKIRRLIQDTLFVGITSMTSRQIHYAQELARFVRELSPDTKIVWGGIHASLLPEQTIAESYVDIVVEGEGEDAIVELADCLSHGSDLNNVVGIYYKSRNGDIAYTGRRRLMNPRNLRMPSWHLIDVSRYDEIGVQTARGCPWRCAFCYNIRFNEGRWRPKESDQVIDELRFLLRKYKLNHITFYDDNFFSSKRRVQEICEKILENGLDISWSTTCRADYLAKYDDDFIELMKRSGVNILFVGSESGSERVLQYIQKDITVDDILGMATNARKHNLRVHTSFVLGFPGETEEDRIATYNVMDRVRTIYPNIYITGIYVYTPYPGNPMYEESIRNGFVPPKDLEEWGDFSQFRCNLPWLSRNERMTLDNLSFITRFAFWHKEIRERYLRFYQYPLYGVLRLSAIVRWKLRFFTLAPEWYVFRTFVK